MSQGLKGCGGPSNCKGGKERAPWSLTFSQPPCCSGYAQKSFLCQPKKKKEIIHKPVPIAGSSVFIPCGTVFLYPQWPHFPSDWADYCAVHLYSHYRVLYPTTCWYSNLGASQHLGDLGWESHACIWLSSVHIVYQGWQIVFGMSVKCLSVCTYSWGGGNSRLNIIFMCHSPFHWRKCLSLFWHLPIKLVCYPAF